MYGEVASQKRQGNIHFLEPPIPISDQIYERLKQQILHGEIEPGERFGERRFRRANGNETG